MCARTLRKPLVVAEFGKRAPGPGPGPHCNAVDAQRHDVYREVGGTSADKSVVWAWTMGDRGGSARTPAGLPQCLRIGGEGGGMPDAL